jgi:hypothetical protein
VIWGLIRADASAITIDKNCGEGVLFACRGAEPVMMRHPPLQIAGAFI